MVFRPGCSWPFLEDAFHFELHASGIKPPVTRTSGSYNNLTFTEQTFTFGLKFVYRYDGSEVPKVSYHRMMKHPSLQVHCEQMMSAVIRSSRSCLLSAQTLQEHYKEHECLFSRVIQDMQPL